VLPAAKPRRTLFDERAHAFARIGAEEERGLRFRLVGQHVAQAAGFAEVGAALDRRDRAAWGDGKQAGAFDVELRKRTVRVFAARS
jgi:hypothetical protein